ncbi:MAG TPA: hypothetical protein VHL53_12960 [Acidimicrobiia bacterium]|nr:hypothetical protein [Acidimicrobiia bacterium]
MLVTNHVFAGAAIGAVLHRRPGLAFAAGVASHLAMDSLPHWGLPRVPESHARFLEVARRDGAAGLAGIALLAGPARGIRAGVLAGIAGATLLDVDKPARHFFDRNPVPAPIQELHERIQREAPHRLRAEIGVAAALLGLSALLVARRRTAPQGAS